MLCFYRNHDNSEVPFISAQVKALVHYLEEKIRSSALPVYLPASSLFYWIRYDLVSGQGFWRSILIRESSHTHTLLLCIRYKEKDQDMTLVQQELQTIKEEIIQESQKEFSLYKVSSFYYQKYRDLKVVLNL